MVFIVALSFFQIEEILCWPLYVVVYDVKGSLLRRYFSGFTSEKMTDVSMNYCGTDIRY